MPASLEPGTDGREEASSSRPAARTVARADTVLVTGLLLLWALPSALFWHTATAGDVLLPYLPRLVWLLPGELWRRAPWALLPLLAAVPFLCHRVLRPLSGRRRSLLLLLAGLLVAVHATWGRALY